MYPKSLEWLPGFGDIDANDRILATENFSQQNIKLDSLPLPMQKHFDWRP